MSEEPIIPRRSGPHVRASDEDRERLVDELNEHTVAGRLSAEDLEQRLQAAYGARTKGELDALRDDLPASPRQAALDRAARRAHLTRRLIQESGSSLGVFVVCAAIWLIDGAHGQFWPIWVLVVFALSLVRNGWALYGPEPDLDAVESHLDARRQRRLERRRRHAERR